MVRGRLWRAANPHLSEADCERWVSALMDARRASRSSRNDPVKLAKARADVDVAKRALGERGPVWWSDGEPDFNRHLTKNTPYAEWFASLKPAVPDADS